MKIGAWGCGLVSVILGLATWSPISAVRAEIGHAVGDKPAVNSEQKQASPNSMPTPNPSVAAKPEAAVAVDQPPKLKEPGDPCERRETDSCSQFRSANATETQVSAAWVGAVASFIAAIATAWAALEAGRAAKAAEKAATLAADSNRLTSEQYAREQRAIITLDKWRVVKLYWDTAGLWIDVYLDLHNVGKSLATDVRSHVNITAASFSEFNDMDVKSNDADNFRTHCEQMLSTRQNHFGGVIIAPSRAYSARHLLLVPTDEIKENISQDGFLGVWVKVCITYKCDIVVGIKYTGRLFIVYEVKSDLPFIINKSSGDLNSSQVSLAPHPNCDMAT